jgi:hypothetical protein
MEARRGDPHPVEAQSHPTTSLRAPEIAQNERSGLPQSLTFFPPDLRPTVHPHWRKYNESQKTTAGLVNKEHIWIEYRSI